MKTCVVSVAFRSPYLEHSYNQEAWIKQNNPDVDCLFFRDELPYKDGIHKQDIVHHFQQSLYGFKPHAINIAKNMGYKKIIWLDPSVLPTSNLNILINSLDNNPVLVITGDTPITRMANSKSIEWFKLNNVDLSGVNHLGGTVYCFNFESSEAINVFELWKSAEENGIFGTQTEFMAGHWADEACMALALKACNVKQYKEINFTYVNQKEL